MSLIHDRRLWLAALVGLLSLSQAGLQMMPQLTLRLIRRGCHRGGIAKVRAAVYQDRHVRSMKPCIDLAGVGFIGLLRRVNGSDDDGALTAIGGGGRRRGFCVNGLVGMVCRAVCATILSVVFRFNVWVVAVGMTFVRKITVIGRGVSVHWSALYMSFDLRDTLKLSVRMESHFCCIAWNSPVLLEDAARGKVSFGWCSRIIPDCGSAVLAHLSDAKGGGA